MKKAELKWSFEQGEFKKTMAFDLSANVKLGRGVFKVKGKISKGKGPSPSLYSLEIAMINCMER